MAAIALSDHAERVKRVLINEQPFDVERVWQHGDRLVSSLPEWIRFRRLRRWRGRKFACRGRAAVLPEGDYYQSDLVGCQLLDAKTGRIVGVVESWQEYGGPPLLVVKAEDGREVLIPFAKSICRSIDLADRKIVADLPEGLEELSS